MGLHGKDGRYTAAVMFGCYTTQKHHDFSSSIHLTVPIHCSICRGTDEQHRVNRYALQKPFVRPASPANNILHIGVRRGFSLEVVLE